MTLTKPSYGAVRTSAVASSDGHERETTDDERGPWGDPRDTDVALAPFAVAAYVRNQFSEEEENATTESQQEPACDAKSSERSPHGPRGVAG
jgi:hypothetical protein